MFATIGRSFRLVKLCLHVLSVDKELAFFPIFSSIGVVVVLLAFMGVSIGIGALDRIDEGAFNPGDIVVALLFYFLAYFVIIFFNSALVFAAHERLAGGDPNIRSGLSGASHRIISIFLWAAIAATIGLILQMLNSVARERGGVYGIIGQVIVSLMGAAWTLVTYFVVPLIVIEHRSLGDAFKTSLGMVRRTWGEQVVANFGLGIAALIAYLIAAGIGALLFLVLSPLGTAGVVAGILIGLALVASVAVIFAALDPDWQDRTARDRTDWSAWLSGNGSLPEARLDMDTNGLIASLCLGFLTPYCPTPRLARVSPSPTPRKRVPERVGVRG